MTFSRCFYVLCEFQKAEENRTCLWLD